MSEIFYTRFSQFPVRPVVPLKSHAFHALLNRDDIMNQTVSLSGISYDEAIFGYVNPGLQAINLVEIVDNIIFDRVAQVPESGSLALLGLGLFGLVMSRRRSIV